MVSTFMIFGDFLGKDNFSKFFFFWGAGWGLHLDGKFQRKNVNVT